MAKEEQRREVERDTAGVKTREWDKEEGLRMGRMRRGLRRGGSGGGKATQRRAGEGVFKE